MVKRWVGWRRIEKWQLVKNMMYLNIKHLEVSDDRHLVAFSTGIKLRGVIEVRNDFRKCSKAFAEMRALQYLVQEKKVFNRDSVDGRGFQFNISRELMDKLSDIGNNPELKVFLYFLRMTSSAFVKCEDVHTESLPLVYSPEDGSQVFCSITSEYKKIPVIARSVHGDIEITVHALNQFIERYNYTNNQNTAKVDPLVQLKKRLESKSLKIEVLPDEVIQSKKLRHLATDSLIVFGNPTSQMHYVTIKSKDRKRRILVTVYRRNQEYNDSKYIDSMIESIVEDTGEIDE